MDETINYEYSYWFNNPVNDEWNQGGEEYYVNHFYKDLIFNLDIPKEGYIVVLGTHNCVSFDKLCKKYGYDRCIGFDLYNPTNHPRVKIKNCLELSEEDNIPIAFCHNDLGSFSTTPKLKLHGQKWAVKNLVKGGYFLGNNNYNRAKIDIETIMKNNGCINNTLLDINFNKNNLTQNRLDGYMISKKK